MDEIWDDVFWTRLEYQEAIAVVYGIVSTVCVVFVSVS